MGFDRLASKGERLRGLPFPVARVFHCTRSALAAFRIRIQEQEKGRVIIHGQAGKH